METEKYYYKIGEVADMLGVNPSLIRFWEREFPSIKPKKNRRGNRVFTESDIEELKKIYNLVKMQGHTLEGAKRILKNNKNPNSKELEIEEKLLKLRGFLAEIKNQFPA
ncbi:MerR family transcriptional regulator [bacterium]|nr:MerR family transcriptional regulator [bacterium]